MREQDLAILRQFMCIQQTVNMLCRDTKQSYDSSVLLTPEGTLDAPPFRERTHVSLCRVQSAPVQNQLSQDSFDEPDLLLQSCNAFGEYYECLLSCGSTVL